VDIRLIQCCLNIEGNLDSIDGYPPVFYAQKSVQGEPPLYCITVLEMLPAAAQCRKDNGAEAGRPRISRQRRIGPAGLSRGKGNPVSGDREESPLFKSGVVLSHDLKTVFTVESFTF
jgi:hypothetical protein